MLSIFFGIWNRAEEAEVPVEMGEEVGEVENLEVLLHNRENRKVG